MRSEVEEMPMAQPATPTAPAKKASRKKAAGSAARPATKPVAEQPPEEAAEAAEAAVGLDMVLVDAARGPLRRLVPPAGTALRFGSALVRRPGSVAGRAKELVQELARVAAGNSELAPAKKDKRFA